MSPPNEDDRKSLAVLTRAHAVSEALASQQEPDALLSAFAAASISESIDLCAVDLHHGGTPTRRVACALATALGAPSVVLQGSTYASQADDAEPRWVTDAAARDTLLGSDAGAALGELRLVSFGSVPLVVGGVVVGTVLLGTRREAGFDDAVERAAIVDLVARVATSLENAWLRLEVHASTRLRDEFLSIVSHELRTPLSTILGWAKLLREGGLTPERSAKALEVIHRSAIAESQIMDELLDASGVLGGHLALTLESASVALIVRDCLASFAESAAKKYLTIRVETSDASVVRVDMARLRQVVRHLMSNAVKFSALGGEIRVSVTSDDERIVLAVADDGLGIAPMALPSLFDRFRQAGDEARGRQGGRGLGLALVRRIIEAHRGDVRAESAGLHEGATFTVTLYRRPREGA